MLTTPFKQLLFRKQSRRAGKDKVPKIMGYDTETSKGLCLLLCDEQTHVHPTCFEDIAHFLTRSKMQGFLGFFYNMRYDFQSILKWLPTDHWVEIMEKGETSYGKYDIFYIPKKMFKLRRNIDRRRRNNKKKGKKTGAKAFTFFDISQFYGKMKLDKAREKYLPHISEKLDIAEFGFDIKNLTEQDMHQEVIIDYCIHDSFICGELARHWVKICNKMDIYPTNFCSPASIASKYFMSKTSIPTINSLLQSPEYLYYPWLACSGAFITVFRRGYFEKVYEYDINSAYPFYMSQLPHLGDGRFFIREGEPMPDATLGWLHVEMDIPYNCYTPPVPIQRKTLCNYFPWGVFDTVITLKEYEHYKKDFTIRPIKGCYWVPEVGFEPVYLYKDVVNELYKNKAKYKKDDFNLYYFCKTVMNGFYGKHLERHVIRDKEHENYGKAETGNFFLPFYGSYILAGTRIAMYEAAKKAGRHIVGCSTDAVFTTQKMGLETGKELGQWDIANEGEMLMIGCGVYAIKTKEKVKEKTRGFRTVTKKEGQKTLFDYVKDFHKSDKITIPIKVNLTMGNMLRQNRPLDMNLIVEEEKSIFINFDTKRLWENQFKNAGELLEKQLDSFPLPYGIVGH